MLESDTAAPAMERPDLTLTFGVFLISVLLGMLLTGIATLQAWNYARDYQEDPQYIKGLVAFVYVADVLHSAALCHSIYSYLIQSFGLYLDLDKILWSFKTATPLAGIVAFTVQGSRHTTYFCFRIKRIAGSWTYASICWFLALSRLVLNFCITADAAIHGRLSALKAPKARAFGMSTLCVGAVSDVLIAAFLCLGLMRTRSGFSSTDKLLDKLVAYTVGSGLLTSIFAICEAITFGAVDNLVFMAFYCILPKLFTNSLLASLNERSYTRREFSNLSYAFRSSHSKPGEQHVTIERTTVTDTDRDIELGKIGNAVYGMT